MSASENPQSPTGAASKPAPMRRFGRFELRALLSKSARSMLWLVFDPRLGQELILCLPRTAPNSPGALAHWLKMANGVARIQHPNIAHVIEVGQVEQWPFIAYDRALGETLDERLARQTAPLPVEAADWVCQFLEGLAFAHEAAHAHRDIQCASLVISSTNQVRVLGLEVAQEVFPATLDFNAVTRRAVRESAEEDVLCVGLLLHRILSGRQVLEQADLQAVVQQMQPLGRELVRMGWETPHPIPEPLRAICNRATDRQTRQRYHMARSFLRALDGWRTAVAQDQGGPIALLMDKLQRIGHLPSTSTALLRVGQSSAMERQHTSALSGLVLQDMALSLELLRRVNNSLQQQGSARDGTVLNMQRAIAMLGLEGVQQAARALKPWPGPLSPVQAELLKSLMKRVQHAGQIAQGLRPAGYDAEVVYLITVMQNLGRLLLQYHFPDDAQQIRQLMLPPEPTADNPHPACMSEQAAAFAVLGCDLDSLGAAVARHWSLGDELLHMIRRQSPEAPVRSTDSDADLLRLTCSLANELVDALQYPEPRRQASIEAATRRYARPLGVGLREIYNAVHPAAPQAEDEVSAPPDHLTGREGGDDAMPVGPMAAAQKDAQKAEADVSHTAPAVAGSVPAPKASALRGRLASLPSSGRSGGQ
ncbi:HDOD domain-containing protein [Roseateles koreensis]|uniref:HDOD domain-containing protein n=1 Tax=Roseateles koreensis TaxID=2987526 RepID=A0ABT5KLI1_9BURK|nr:HDOD domain-containing protein [Roseateles koreensis]MDC8783714.1 HDOD domain-containing protein [Roseateles koreensis]